MRTRLWLISEFLQNVHFFLGSSLGFVTGSNCPMFQRVAKTVNFVPQTDAKG